MDLPWWALVAISFAAGAVLGIAIRRIRGMPGRRGEVGSGGAPPRG